MGRFISTAFLILLSCGTVFSTAAQAHTCPIVHLKADNAADFKREFKAFRKFDEMPFIDFNSFDSYKIVHHGFALGTFKVIRAQKDGKEYFIKVSTSKLNGTYSSRSLLDVLNEFSWAQAIHSQLHLGAQVYGATIYEGHFALVSDWKEGFQVFAIPMETPFKVTALMKEKALQQMKDQAARLMNAGIYPKDLQFRLSPTGDVTLIDTEKYEFLDKELKTECERYLRDTIEGFAKTLQDLPE